MLRTSEHMIDSNANTDDGDVNAEEGRDHGGRCSTAQAGAAGEVIDAGGSSIRVCVVGHGKHTCAGEFESQGRGLRKSAHQ
jgi:hypothetical protein